jgi:potassium/chloride transporter 4/5/6
MKWGTLGSAVRYNIVSSALNSLAKSAGTATVSTEVTLPMSEAGRHFSNNYFSSSDNICVLSVGRGGFTDIAPNEVAHFHSTTSNFHAKNWRPNILTIVDVDPNGNPTNLRSLSLASQLQQAGKGINMVIAIIDRSPVAMTASAASAVESICSRTVERGSTHLEDDDRWRNEEESLTVASSGMDHRDTVKLIQRSKSLLTFHMTREGMEGFAEVSTTEGNFFEAVWSAVIHSGLGPLSPNIVLMLLPSFPTFEGDESCNANETISIAHEHSRIKTENYLRTINGILNLGKAVILFKSSPSYPRNGDIIPERGIIDIWWIVHDGGLLLLLSFLLSKHAVWLGADDEKRKKNRLRRRAIGAKLRLFAVTTSPRENAEKLHKNVTEHLERVRIQADVTVVEDLARTNIAHYMRDNMGSSRDETLTEKIGMSRPPNNHAASLRKDGISTQHMTLGEVFASDCYENKPSGSMDEGGIVDRNTNLVHSDSGIQAASVLNEILRRKSYDANLIVSNLPFIRKDHNCEEYFKFLHIAWKDIENVMLVRGSGAEVITANA